MNAGWVPSTSPRLSDPCSACADPRLYATRRSRYHHPCPRARPARHSPRVLRMYLPTCNRENSKCCSARSRRSSTEDDSPDAILHFSLIETRLARDRRSLDGRRPLLRTPAASYSGTRSLKTECPTTCLRRNPIIDVHSLRSRPSRSTRGAARAGRGAPGDSSSLSRQRLMDARLNLPAGWGQPGLCTRLSSDPPCFTVEWLTGTTRVTSLGQPLLFGGSEGIASPSETEVIGHTGAGSRSSDIRSFPRSGSGRAIRGVSECLISGSTGGRLSTTRIRL